MLKWIMKSKEIVKVLDKNLNFLQRLLDKSILLNYINNIVYTLYLIYLEMRIEII